MNSETTNEASENKTKRISEAVDVAAALRLGGNEARKTDGFTLLGLVNLVPDLPWSEAQAPLRSAKEILEFVNVVYAANLASNSIESIRDALAGFRREGLVRFNPDRERHPANSPRSVYQIEPHALEVTRTFGTPEWPRILEKYTARQKVRSKLPAPKTGSGTDAFILYNEKQKDVEAIIGELESRGISTYFWRRDIPAGEPWEEFESRQLREARTVLVFLGDSGWGPNHLRIVQEAQRLEKRLIPILTGNPSEADLNNAYGLFRKRRYLDLRQITPDGIDLIVREVRRDSLPERRSEVVPRSAQIDRIIKALVDGNEEQRSDALSQIQRLTSEQSTLLAQRLCVEIEGRFSPKGENDFASAIRDPKKLSSIRSWMLSSLIWSDAEGPESRRCILNHLKGDYEPDRNVRFWSLAGLYQRQVSYLSEVVQACVADRMPEVAGLAWAIMSPDDKGLHEFFRVKLNSSEFERTWQVLRILRVIPIPELAGNVCALLDRSNQGTPLAYDVLYALTNPVMGREASKILSTDPGVAQVVARVIREVRESNENAAKKFTALLAQFEPADVDRAIQEAQQGTETSEPAKMIWGFLQDYRRRRGNQNEASVQEEEDLAGDESKRKHFGSGYTYGPAGYSSEFCGVGGTKSVPDHLGVKALAHRLAELMALRETKLPLAVGLFGNWGSGKSHFMNLMDRHMKKLANETASDWERRAAEPGAPLRPDPTGEGPWCREIVPVYFNAWHYIDTNLWASLVSQIFDSLFTHLRPKQDDLAKVQKLLEQASGATARAAEEVALAHTATERARNDLDLAQKNRLGKETLFDGLLHGLRSLLPEVRSADLQEEVLSLLDVQKEVHTLSDLKAVLDEAKSLKGRARTFWNTAWKSEGRGWRVMWFVGAIVLAPLLPTIIANVFPVISNWLQGIGKVIAGLLTGLPALVVWIRPILGEAGRHLKKMEGWKKQAEAAQERARKTPDVMKAEVNVTAAAAMEEAAKIRLAEAEAREKALKEEARNLSPERRLGRFIEQRAQSSDYRGQLGLVSLARRDFQELSDIFADTEALKEKITTLKNSGEPDKKLEAEQIEKLSKSIDRIVLFVDDLDRCQPEKVVDVLQAVHLLLAFPLFGVVVGVDQRCLRQSLRMQFKGLLNPKWEQNADQKVVQTGDDDERPATPLDYLEKIFHVPFHLPTMEKQGFETLIDKLTEPPPSPAVNLVEVMESAEQRRGKGDFHFGDMSGSAKLKAGGDNIGGYKTTVSPEKPVNRDDDTTLRIGIDPPSATAAMSSAESASLPGAAAQVIGSVPLQPWERTALKDYHALIRTPRGATRLLNTYRLLRAGILADEWDSFRGDGTIHGEFRIAMLLLAAAAGYPAVAREWFTRLRNANPTALSLFDEQLETDRSEWTQFKKVYDGTFVHTTPQPTKDLFVKWLDRVERFAF